MYKHNSQFKFVKKRMVQKIGLDKSRPYKKLWIFATFFTTSRDNYFFISIF